MADGPKQPIYSALMVSGQSTMPQKMPIVALCSKKNAAAATGLLMGSYGDYGKADPDILQAGLQSLFMDYPEAFVRQVVKDLPRQCKWMPTIAEAAEMLDALVYEQQCRDAQVEMDRRAEASAEARAKQASAWEETQKIEEIERAAKAAKREAELAAETPEEREARMSRTVQAWRSTREYEQRMARKWDYDPSKAYHYPMSWLLLTKEERWDLQAKGEAPVAVRADLI